MCIAIDVREKNMTIKKGSVWAAVGEHWGRDYFGQLVVVVQVTDKIIYRYMDIDDHCHSESGEWNIDSFTNNFQLVQE